MKLSSFFFFLVAVQIVSAQNNNVSFVNPFIGTGGHGHTFPGATVPFGMVQLSPDTRTEGWDGASGYHFDDSTVLGFSHTHLNGTGISDFCDVLLTPSVSGSFKPLRFNHKDETAKAGYFKTIVYDENGEKIEVELTSSERVGFHRYRFPKNVKNITFVVTLNKRNKLTGSIQKVNNQSIKGNFITTAWAKNRHLAFGMETNLPFNYLEKPNDNKRYLTFDVSKTHELLIKVALSPVSEANAFENMKSEINHWDFEKPRKEAEQKWAKYLNRIQIEGSTEQKTIFYTALYHTMIHPSVWQDVNGDYRGLDNKIHNVKGFAYHSIFSLWDTYRGAHPLYTIVCPEKVSDFVNSFIDDFEKTGHLPMWNFPGSETWCMIGNHAIPVIADAYLKGIKGFDAEKALKAMVGTANRDSLGLKQYRIHGYIPADTEGESVSKTLENAYDDYCIAQMAKAMGKNDMYETFIRRSQNWKNQFNPKTGFFQAKMNETFVEPFEPREVNFHFTEGNAWQYAFAVQHDIEGLIETLGGKAAFEAKLDAFFSADSKTTGRDQADITGLIGQYAHGNEPSHHITYLYNYVGRPDKTQSLVKKILNEFYKNAPDGLIGNEDCGQMSAWYVLSSMGIYPSNPCGGTYELGSPLFSSELINKDGIKLSINVRGISEKNIFVKSFGISSGSNFASNDTITSLQLTHDLFESDFRAIAITMSDTYTNSRINNSRIPRMMLQSEYIDNGFGLMPKYDLTKIDRIIPMPYVAKGTKLFKKKQTIELACGEKGADIYFSTDGTTPSLKYTKPIEIQQTTSLRFVAKNGQKQSNEAKATFKESSYGFPIQLKNPPAPQYSGNSDNPLADGERGNEHWQLGGWQGFEGIDLEVVMDLKEVKSFKRLALSCAQDQNAWIFFPSEIQFFTSEDGKNYTESGRVRPKIDENPDGVQMREFEIKKSNKARYIKIVAKPLIPIPDWHKGAGGKGWIFTDEIIVE